jgi:hypothetical protein
MIATPLFYKDIIKLSALTLYDHRAPERPKKNDVDAQDWKCWYLKTRHAAQHTTGRNTTHHLEHTCA